jgi:hypothetical protein
MEFQADQRRLPEEPRKGLPCGCGGGRQVSFALSLDAQDDPIVSRLKMPAANLFADELFGLRTAVDSHRKCSGFPGW